MEKDYYQILGVDPKAAQKQIKDAYRRLAFEYHPDRNTGNTEAAEKMKVVNEAYAVLSDPEKRAEYDTVRQRFGSSSAYSRFRQNYSEEDIFSGSDINQIFEEVAKNFGLRGFEDIFREFYGQRYQSFEFKGHGFFGGGFFFFGGLGQNKERPAVGAPSKIGSYLEKFSRFLIKKAIEIQLPRGEQDITDEIFLTPDLAQKGGPYAYFHKNKAKKLVVKIPPGVREGQRIRLEGMGKEGSPPGDLYLKVRIRKPLLQKVQEFISTRK